MLVSKVGRTVLVTKVVPNSHQNKIVGWQGKELKIRVAAPPQKGKANKELIKFLAKELNIANNDIEIIKGLTSSRKKILIPDGSIKNLKIKINN